MALVLTE